MHREIHNYIHTHINTPTHTHTHAHTHTHTHTHSHTHTLAVTKETWPGTRPEARKKLPLGASHTERDHGSRPKGAPPQRPPQPGKTGYQRQLPDWQAPMRKLSLKTEILKQ